jgi:putative methyltransferase (TIGR04325 family)
MNRLKLFIKLIVPRSVLGYFTGFFYGWTGNYSNWEEAKRKCSGYDSQSILEKVKEAAFLVKNGKTIYERDSAIFDTAQYSFPLLSGLMWIAAQNNGRLNVLDFGGSLGSTYYQNKRFLDSLNYVRWSIVEQPDFVYTGLESFSNEILHFYYSIDDCLKENNIDIILLSSVLQYLESPFDLLNRIKSKKIKYIIIDRTPFTKGQDRITIQKVHPKLYNASYPCWFFNKTKFLDFITADFDLIMEFDSLDEANIVSEFKGFLFELTTNQKTGT